ncbi:hypothetical protein BABINDRAFT_159551 [Babjeviella inositovora NRRL Y-12698]|uniref:Phospholipid/glycerol acyltransferase domain-containing protein n=1 Tax=Babjeviella inositovora NRRL Y-12698 TaxID=984486 RepID=A0A1E3QZT1_9ASCO|nr:uncharacterized protein BABINDRAFT_159551 [Babjeviella inositovora NRRL Y-12698]ODQ83095.1 hypothetical protein BABINDRAFT_159551 [Babjeviella inositovora NRRL Y-12698]
MPSPKQLLHAFAMALMALLVVFSIIFTHILVKLFLRDNALLQKLVFDFTRKTFIMGLTAMFAIFAPTSFHVTTDASVPAKSFVEDADVPGFVRAFFIDNSVLIGNHQIYTDWIFLWYLTYIGNVATDIHILMKDSILKIPVIGWGMGNFRWIYMSRKWETDKTNMSNRLLEMDANARGWGPAQGVKPVYSPDALIKWPPGFAKNTQRFPYMFLMYPEGTNISENTQPRSDAYIAKTGQKPLKHVLMPRVTGLYHCLRELRKTATVVYDITAGYSGVKAGQYPQDVYSLTNVVYDGKNPAVVSLHIRSYRLEDIPMLTQDHQTAAEEAALLKEFEAWLFKIWYEKDALMDYYYQHGTFVQEGETITNNVTFPLKLRRAWDIWYVYVVPLTFVIAARAVFQLGGKVASLFV